MSQEGVQWTVWSFRSGFGGAMRSTVLVTSMWHETSGSGDELDRGVWHRRRAEIKVGQPRKEMAALLWGVSVFLLKGSLVLSSPPTQAVSIVWYPL